MRPAASLADQPANGQPAESSENYSSIPQICMYIYVYHKIRIPTTNSKYGKSPKKPALRLNPQSLQVNRPRNHHDLQRFLCSYLAILRESTVPTPNQAFSPKENMDNSTPSSGLTPDSKAPCVYTFIIYIYICMYIRPIPGVCPDPQLTLKHLNPKP